MERTAHTLLDLEEAARAFVASLQPRKEGATLVTLSGELGAGKTAFAKAAAKAFGIEEEVTSPTFVLEKIYSLPKSAQGFSHFVHIDAYRLSGGAELHALGFDELMRQASTVIFLEWPERVADTLPPPSFRITCTANDDASRTLVYE